MPLEVRATPHNYEEKTPKTKYAVFTVPKSWKKGRFPGDCPCLATLHAGPWVGRTSPLLMPLTSLALQENAQDCGGASDIAISFPLLLLLLWAWLLPPQLLW